MPPRAIPLPDLHGWALIGEFLAEIQEEEELSRALGVDLTPAAPRREHAPRVYGQLEVWFRRSEEVHELSQAARRAERMARPRTFANSSPCSSLTAQRSSS